MRVILSDTAYDIRVEGRREPPLGMSSIASFLRLQGHDVFTVSPDLEGWSLAATPAQLMRGKPDVIGLSALDCNSKKALKIARQLRRKGFRGHIALGGYWPTFYDREIIENFPEVDFCIRGEGEIPMMQLLNALEGITPMEHVPSLTYRRGDTIYSNPMNPLLQDLDSLPFVARDYTSEVIRMGGAPSIYTEKGCPASCAFCDIVAFYRLAKGNKLRARSAKNIVDEIELLVRSFGQRHITFVDDNFVLPGKRSGESIDEFVNEIQQRRLKVYFDLMCRAELVQEPIFRKLKEVGLNRVFIGAESGHERGLQTYNKKITIEDTYRALNVLNDLDISFTIGMILVDPWTTYQEFMDNLQFLRDIKRRFKSKEAIFSVSPKLILHKGTLLFKEMEEQGKLLGDWINGYTYKIRSEIKLPLFLWQLLTEWRPEFIRKLYLQFR